MNIDHAGKKMKQVTLFDLKLVVMVGGSGKKEAKTHLIYLSRTMLHSIICVMLNRRLLNRPTSLKKELKTTASVVIWLKSPGFTVGRSVVLRLCVCVCVSVRGGGGGVTYAPSLSSNSRWPGINCFCLWRALVIIVCVSSGDGPE